MLEGKGRHNSHRIRNDIDALEASNKYPFCLACSGNHFRPPMSAVTSPESSWRCLGQAIHQCCNQTTYSQVPGKVKAWTQARPWHQLRNEEWGMRSWGQSGSKISCLGAWGMMMANRRSDGCVATTAKCGSCLYSLIYDFVEVDYGINCFYKYAWNL